MRAGAVAARGRIVLPRAGLPAARVVARAPVARVVVLPVAAAVPPGRTLVPARPVVSLSDARGATAILHVQPAPVVRLRVAAPVTASPGSAAAIGRAARLPVPVRVVHVQIPTPVRGSPMMIDAHAATATTAHAVVVAMDPIVARAEDPASPIGAVLPAPATVAPHRGSPTVSVPVAPPAARVRTAEATDAPMDPARPTDVRPRPGTVTTSVLVAPPVARVRTAEATDAPMDPARPTDVRPRPGTVMTSVLVAAPVVVPPVDRPQPAAVADRPVAARVHRTVRATPVAAVRIAATPVAAATTLGTRGATVAPVSAPIW
ncbi:hypothetical protein ATK74_1046 [Propionicimonas paludicola]|uniref:Uncharacterized protein n=1 Tax=Propionicimonas paludicola TaxID=185243 RepID=A0A2A9CQN5_9ACTN|nr:hypothetical protein ATK74_1046 [Propionicimonas paludicola]